MQSGKWTLNMEDLKSLLMTALAFGAAALITYLMENLTQLHLGDFEPIVMLVLGMVLKFVQKLIKN